MKKTRILGCAAALSLTAIAGLPAAGQAQSPFPSGCGSEQDIDLRPLANIQIKTCELALAPNCLKPIIKLPPNALIRNETKICSPIVFGPLG